MRFIVSFILMGIIMMQGLQNYNGALKEKRSSSSEPEKGDNGTALHDDKYRGEYPIELGLWTYCVSSSVVYLTNRQLRVHYFTDGACMEFDKDLQTLKDDGSPTNAVENYQFLIAGRAMSVVGILLTCVVSFLVEMGTRNRCMLCIAAILNIIDIIAQVTLVIVCMAYYGKHSKTYSMRWPWYMSFVALGLLVILQILICCLCKKQGKGGKCCQQESGDNDEPKRGNCFRWVFILFFLPALVFQCFIHAPDGAQDHKDEYGDYNSRIGLWRLCFDKKTEVSWGMRYVYSYSMCIKVDGYLPSDLVDYVLLIVATITIFIAHGCTCSGFFLAILPAYSEGYKSRKYMFIVRLINMIIAAIAITIACICSTCAVPDGWSLGYAFALPWISFVIIWILCLICLVQVACKKNLLGEAPEADAEEEQKKGEKKKLNEQKPKKEESNSSSKKKEKEPDDKMKKEEEARKRQQEQEEEEEKERLSKMPAPPPYTEKDSASNNKKESASSGKKVSTRQSPEPAPPSESEVLDREDSQPRKDTGTVVRSSAGTGAMAGAPKRRVSRRTKRSTKTADESKKIAESADEESEKTDDETEKQAKSDD
ncbi:uncharacterized protein LOC142349986 isoform X2 [Convolutriloba macropyga]|uniref:uncharacterized protein LOC142349986 isoform X2 n=1 Tax=Convolutriloba macropyga TaxID=536237 RepID=UPI003F51CBCD